MQILKTEKWPLDADHIQPTTTTQAQQRWAVVLKNEAIAHLIIQETDIITLYVKEEHRRQGHARALLQAALAEVSTLILEVRASNIPAQKLYESLGFEQIHTREKYYSNPVEDGIVYTLTL